MSWLSARINLLTIFHAYRSWIKEIEKKVMDLKVDHSVAISYQMVPYLLSTIYAVQYDY